MLPSWKERPNTVAYLLNPAFCGEVIHRFISQYQKTNKVSVPFQLLFLVLPLVLHKEIRESLPSKSNKNFITWVEENQSIKMILPKLIKEIVPYTKESIMFLMIYKVIEINGKGEIINLIKPKKIKSQNEVAECYNKAELVGKWFANSNCNSQSIFINLGIKP